MSAANELITRGWCQSTYEDDEGRVCLRTAVRLAYGNKLYSYVVENALRRVTGETEVTPGLAFNDTPGRTYDEVLRALKELDELLEGLT